MEKSSSRLTDSKARSNSGRSKTRRGTTAESVEEEEVNKPAETPASVDGEESPKTISVRARKTPVQDAETKASFL